MSKEREELLLGRKHPTESVSTENSKPSSALDIAKSALNKEEAPEKKRQEEERKAREKRKRQEAREKARQDEQRLQNSPILEWFPNTEWEVIDHQGGNTTVYQEEFPLRLSVQDTQEGTVVRFALPERDPHARRNFGAAKEVWAGPVVRSAADVGKEVRRYNESCKWPDSAIWSD